MRVRPINKTDAEIKGEWAESGNLYVDSGKAVGPTFKANPVANPRASSPWLLEAGGGRQMVV